MRRAARGRSAEARTASVGRILASVAVPLSIVPLVAVGFLYVRRNAAVAPAAARTSSCHPLPAPAVWDPVGMTVPRQPGAVPVIAYHRVVSHGPSPNRQSPSRHSPNRPVTGGAAVTRDQLARQLVSLRASGYTAISAAAYLRAAAGKPVRLPSHPILITFDGDASTYCAADAILQRTGLQAVMFAAAGRHEPDCASCLTVADRRRMRASGRWEIAWPASPGHAQPPAADTGNRALAAAASSSVSRLEVRRTTTAIDLLRWLRARARRAGGARAGAAPAGTGAVGQ